MIKHSLKDDLVHISINKVDFSFRIPLKTMGSTISWKIGNKDTKGIIIRNVSSWTAKLFTKKTTDDKYIKQFKDIVQEYCPNNAINWKETFLAINIQNEYHWLVSINKSAEKKISEEEIILTLKKKYKLK